MNENFENGCINVKVPLFWKSLLNKSNLETLKDLPLCINDTPIGVFDSNSDAVTWGRYIRAVPEFVIEKDKDGNEVVKIVSVYLDIDVEGLKTTDAEQEILNKILSRK